MTTNAPGYMKAYYKRRKNGKSNLQKYQQNPKARKENRIRKKARYVLEKAGRVRKFDGKEVDHKKPLSIGGGNSSKNLRVTSFKYNRTRKKKTSK